MMRRRILPVTLLLAVVFLSIAVSLLWWSPTTITQENSNKIKKGMALAEVEELLGGAARNESGLPDNFINDAFVPLQGEHAVQERRWASRKFVVVVGFNASERVVRRDFFVYHVPDNSFLGRVRGWMRL
jgi:hypothetical protein